MAEKNSAFRALHTALHKMFADANLKAYCMANKHYGGLQRSKAIVVSKFNQALAKVRSQTSSLCNSPIMI
jgi:hypothetical protein